MASLKPNLLCIAPPFAAVLPPLGIASLMGYLKANGCREFDFVDLRLGTSSSLCPTFRPYGIFGENYVIDVPDLPLVLELLRAVQEGRKFSLVHHEVLENYALARGINPGYLTRYLTRLDNYLEASLAQLPELRFVGFSTWASNLFSSLLAAAHLKRRANPPFIVFGGPQVTESRNSARLALKSGLVDAVALGEGEETLLQLWEQCQKTGGRPGPVGGCLQLDGEGRFVESERPLLRIREKPLPDFTCMPIQAYQKGGPARTLPFEFSRGCTDKCAFCSEWTFWRQFRPSPPELVVEQMKELVSLHGPNSFTFADSLLNGVKPRLVEMAQKLSEAALGVTWGGFLRANVDDEMASLLSQSGFSSAFVGIESLSQETLDLMNKRRTVADNITSLRALLKAGIQVNAGIIPGFPGDTRERFRATCSQIHLLQTEFPGRVKVNEEFFVVTPGQPIFPRLGDYGLVGHHWPAEVLDIAPSFRPITEEILCHVSGANQGLERLGEARLRSTLNADDDDAPIRDPFNYGQEDLGERRVVESYLVDEWSMAQFKSRGGMRTGLLMTATERRTLDDSLAGASILGCAIQEAFDSFLEDVRREHPILPDAERPRVVCVQNKEKAGEADLLTLSPFVICRDTKAGDEPLLLAEMHTKNHLRLQSGFLPVLQRMRDQFTTEAGFHGLLKEHGIPEEAGRVALAAMLSAGIAVVRAAT